MQQTSIDIVDNTDVSHSLQLPAEKSIEFVFFDEMFERMTALEEQNADLMQRISDLEQDHQARIP
jgi:hypothetical protein